MGGKRFPAAIVPTDPAVLGYLAGIIDGEGCIGITSAKGPASRNTSHALRLYVTSTSEELMVWLIDTFGAGRRVSRNEKPGKWATRYDWVVYGHQAEQLLRTVLPHLVIKQAQARLALEFRSLSREQKPYAHKRGGAPALDESVVIEREELKRQMSILNRRGPLQKEA
jgi:hypothetical protein